MVFTVFRIVLEEQPFQKGHFKIYFLLKISSKRKEAKEGKAKEGNVKKLSTVTKALSFLSSSQGAGNSASFCDIIRPVLKGKDSVQDTDRGCRASPLKQTPAEGSTGHGPVRFNQNGLSTDYVPGKVARDGKRETS